jgi:hypothetical protein
MSSPKSYIPSSLEDILTALELRLEAEEAIAQLPLTRALEQCLLFAQSQNLPDLVEYSKKELLGYSIQPPNYRYVELSYFDAGGQLINGLNQYSIYPVVTGVSKLEPHLKNGLTMMLPKQILTFLSEVSGREVDTGHVSSMVITNLLESIRKETTLRSRI